MLSLCTTPLRGHSQTKFTVNVYMYNLLILNKIPSHFDNLSMIDYCGIIFVYYIHYNPDAATSSLNKVCTWMSSQQLPVVNQFAYTSARNTFLNIKDQNRTAIS